VNQATVNRAFEMAVRQPEVALPRRISVLGATGSIGTSTLDLVGRTADQFDVVALTAQKNVAGLAELALRHSVELAVIGDEALYGELKAALSGSGVQVAAGTEALIDAAVVPVDCVFAAISGVAGLAPSLAAAKQGRRLALANKECLVAAGDLFMREIAEAGTELLPVDSEHSAALQALTGELAAGIERIILTASGGPFRTWTSEALERATPEQALCHPNWSMGSKITIDSATLMNKGLELIEAYHLFPVEVAQLDAIVHPQSIVHCLVEYCDGSVMAQLANPDMRTPIAYSLSWPVRMPTPTERLDLVKLGSLTFEAPDLERFPALEIAKSAMKAGGGAPTVLNAANEVAVAMFLEKRIGFMDIARVVGHALEHADVQGVTGSPCNLEDVLEIDRIGRVLARDVIADMSTTRI